jgi:hypothetical protein
MKFFNDRKSGSFIGKSINIISNYFIVSIGLQKLSQIMSLIGILICERKQVHDLIARTNKKLIGRAFESFLFKFNFEKYFLYIHIFFLILNIHRNFQI